MNLRPATSVGLTLLQSWDEFVGAARDVQYHGIFKFIELAVTARWINEQKTGRRGHQITRFPPLKIKTCPNDSYILIAVVAVVFRIKYHPKTRSHRNVIVELKAVKSLNVI